MNPQIDALKAALPLVPPRQRNFASSLIASFEKTGDLTNKQWYWVEKLASDIETAGVPDFTKEVETVGPMHGLISLFDAAKKQLKYPAISLQLQDGSPVKLKIAGSLSKTPGYVQVSDGGPYGSGKWYGRVSPEGAWEKSSLLEKDEVQARKVSNLLKELAHDPAGTAAKYGKLTGRCCFCNTVLSDEKSTEVGYGPVCAKNYGLPWGAKAKEFTCN